MGYWPKRIKVKRHNWVTQTGYQLLLLRVDCWRHNFSMPSYHHLRPTWRRGSWVYCAQIGDVLVEGASADACTIRLARTLGVVE